jgi:hypothetical protein
MITEADCSTITTRREAANRQRTLFISMAHALPVVETGIDPLVNDRGAVREIIWGSDLITVLG